MSRLLLAVLCPAPIPSGLDCSLTQEGLSSSLVGLSLRSISSTPGGSSRLLIQFLTASMAFARSREARLPLVPALWAGVANDAAEFA